MKRQLKGLGWAALGAGLVIAIVWAGTTVWTFLHERNIERRVTRIERIIVHRQKQRTPNQLQAAPKLGVPKGVVVGHGHSTPSGLPGPVQGPPANPPAATPEPPGLLDPVTHQVTPLLDCHLTALGIRICN